ncbi:MAG: ATP-binding protein [Burkholderiaceae bacterium]
MRNLRRLPEQTERESALLALEQGVDRATRLIEQLLSLARQDSEQMHRHEARLLELGELSRTGIAELAAQAARQSIDLGLHGPAKGRVLGHEEALQILLRNLLENAIKYCPPGATVDVSVLQRPDGIEWVVEDSGPGIATDDRTRLMRRFHRGQHGGAITGSGLGLAIVQAIAERHDAELQLARSARLGGLRASVRFPLPPS